MRLCRFSPERLGVVLGDEVADITVALQGLPSAAVAGDPLCTNLAAVVRRAHELLPSAPRLPLAGLQLLSPVERPSKILGAPINYRDHIAESRVDDGIAHGRKVTAITDWGLFLKAPSSLIGFGQEVRLRFPERRNDHECELTVVIGQTCSQVKAAQAMAFVCGYAIGLDMTLRGPEFQCWRKSIDTYSVLGPWLVTADEVPHPENLELELLVNNELRQRANTRDLILDIPELIEFASSMYTLYPGDLIMTGTPAGVGPVKPGDKMQVRIEGVGHGTVSVGAHYV
ncbi:MAG TPA: fumarylacetoacetate hydrolase family protein [Rubrivivax sp.]|nr:fumarylacetoacetate hydrolase family protein [Rubrivivax sp.]